MNISPQRFRKAFTRFQKIHKEGCGHELVSFSDTDSLAFKHEDYKLAIPGRAAALLEASKWTKNEIGSGSLLKRVIAAIELPGNNLLQWQARQGPMSRVHISLLEALKKPAARLKLETLFFDLFKRGKVNQQTFEGIVELCGKRYELLGYLFFIADPRRFLPLRPSSFDKALAELGVDLKTGHHCSWENYLAFIQAMQSVRDRLRAEGVLDASLLDAHSFCWMLARNDGSRQTDATPIKTRMRPFGGRLLPAGGNRKFTPNDDAAVRDMQHAAIRRQASGQIAEEIALEAERERLRKEGRKDLAEKVRLVSDKPGLGYDILSYETNDLERFIEVKNVTNGNRFFLSEGEWLNSRQRKNYWFYLVGGVDSKQRLLDCVPASVLSEKHLQAVQYLVRFSAR